MISWLAIFLCWGVSFLFAGIEAGLLAIDPVRLRAHAKRKRRSVLKLAHLLDHPERLLVTVLLITNLADILALLLLTRQFVLRFGYAGFLLALIVAVPIYVFVLGVLPKSLFRRFPFRALAPLAGLLELVSMLLWPVLELGKQLGRLFLPQKSKRARLFAAREELKQITTESEREGSLTSAERAMIHNVVDFRGVQARDVMVPLSSAITVEPDTPVKEVVKLSAQTQVDRLPVISSNGEAIGLVNTLDILLDNESRPLRDYTRRILLAPETEPAYRVLRRLRAARLGLAAVVNGEKKLTGIVTAEELIKRLVSSVPVSSAAKS
jgi:CBS domain containing-hemolysin-like protein